MLKFTIDKLVMQEVAYHISSGLSIGLHMKKKEPWPIIHLRIGLYAIRSLKEVDVEVEKIKKFKFDMAYEGTTV